MISIAYAPPKRAHIQTSLVINRVSSTRKKPVFILNIPCYLAVNSMDIYLGCIWGSCEVRVGFVFVRFVSAQYVIQ